MRAGFRKSALLAAVCVPLAACSGNLTENSGLSAGIYNLTSVNDQPLPFPLVFIDNQNQIEITLGALTISTNGDFVDSITYRYTESGSVEVVTDVVIGKWSQQGSTITFTPSDGSSTYTMILNGGTRLSQGVGNFGLIYTR